MLKNRKKHEFLDLMILAYVPEGDVKREKSFTDLITNINFQDPMCSILTSHASPYIKFYKIANKELAEELKIDSLDNMTYLRIKDSRGWFHSHRSKESYTDSSTLKEYIEKRLATEFKINGHELQLNLQIYFERFILSNENSPASGNYSSLDDLTEAITSINPLIIPLFSLKQLQITVPKVYHSLSSENSKLLVISLKKDSEEKNLDEVQGLFYSLKLEEFAKNHPEITIIMGYPEFIYHLPIRDIAIYHYEPIEIRLIDVNQGKAVNSVYLDEGMQLSDLLQIKDPHLETSPPSLKQNAEIYTKQEFYDHVLKHNNRCFFVMNCSKTCPACTYQDTFFQQAAAESSTCKFIKYYVSNQSPYYKGPNSTPRYHLYLPGSTDPIVYETKVHGLKPENFLNFVNDHLANIKQ